MPSQNTNTVDWYVEDALDTLWVNVKEAISEDGWIYVIKPEEKCKERKEAEGKCEKST